MNRTMQNVMKGQPIGPPIELGGKTRIADPRDDKLGLVVDGFLAELQKLYSQQVDEDVIEGLHLNRSADNAADTPQNRIKEFRAEVRERAFGDKERHEGVILASVGPEKHPRYIGFACIKPYAAADFAGSALELAYLWTPPRYRKLAVAEHIIAKAHGFARQNGFDYLVIEVLQTLNDMVTYFLKGGFQEHGDDGHGRLIFKFETTKTFAL